MKTLVRCAVPALCVVALAACNRDRERADRDRFGVDRASTAESDRGTLGDRSGVTERKDYDDHVEHTGTTTITGANVARVSNDSAIDRIVAARCERELKCNNVGADKEYASREACSQKLKTSVRDDLKAGECPGGIDQKELNECLEEIQNEGCGNPIDTIGRLAACRSSDLCLKTDMPNR